MAYDIAQENALLSAGVYELLLLPDGQSVTIAPIDLIMTLMCDKFSYGRTLRFKVLPLTSNTCIFTL